MRNNNIAVTTCNDDDDGDQQEQEQITSLEMIETNEESSRPNTVGGQLPTTVSRQHVVVAATKAVKAGQFSIIKAAAAAAAGSH